MTLVDTSVWVEHLRNNNEKLVDLLNNGDVLCHPFIVGELACGNMKNRDEILSLLQALPSVITAEHEEVLQFIENNKLMGKGVGYIDAHLLASAELTRVRLWTFDKRLNELASKLRIDFSS